MAVPPYMPKRRVILLSTEIYGNDRAGSEQCYKPQVELHYNRTKGAVDAGDHITREHSSITTILYCMWVPFHI
jgi:hypothetical protein